MTLQLGPIQTIKMNFSRYMVYIMSVVMASHIRNEVKNGDRWRWWWGWNHEIVMMAGYTDLALLIIRVLHTSIRERGLAIVKVLPELGQPACAGTGENELVWSFALLRAYVEI
jgi:hypothetical protein